MNQLLELSHLLTDEGASRAAAVRDNSKHWLAVDYEAISASLGIEINTEMSPLVIVRVVGGRLGEMPNNEKEEIPSFIWECLTALDNTGLGNFGQYHPNIKDNNLVPFTVRKTDGITIQLVSKGMDMHLLMVELGNQPRWENWCKVYKPEVSLHPDNDCPVIKSEQFAPWSEREIETIIGDFYEN